MCSDTTTYSHSHNHKKKKNMSNFFFICYLLLQHLRAYFRPWSNGLHHLPNFDHCILLFSFQPKGHQKHYHKIESLSLTEHPVEFEATTLQLYSIPLIHSYSTTLCPNLIFYKITSQCLQNHSCILLLFCNLLFREIKRRKKSSVSLITRRPETCTIHPLFFL